MPAWVPENGPDSPATHLPASGAACPKSSAECSAASDPGERCCVHAGTAGRWLKSRTQPERARSEESVSCPPFSSCLSSQVPAQDPVNSMSSPRVSACCLKSPPLLPPFSQHPGTGGPRTRAGQKESDKYASQGFLASAQDEGRSPSCCMKTRATFSGRILRVWMKRDRSPPAQNSMMR